jgi:hypothetical protein
MFTRYAKPQIWLTLTCVVALACCGAALSAEPPSPKAPAAGEPAAEPLPVGFSLGEYQVKDTRPVDNEKFTLEFHLYAMVKAENEKAVAALLPAWEHRIRDQVLTAVRLTPVDLFEEVELTNFSRRILLRLRRAVPELAIEQVVITDFRMLTQ